MKRKIPIFKIPRVKKSTRGIFNRERVIMVTLTDVEYDLVRRIAQATGITMARLLRESALKMSDFDKISVGMTI